MSGSSPLMRGKLGLIGDHGRHVRLIPAHAGKTSTTQAWTSTARAHPRSHWENDISTASSRQSSGLSPLTEGKLLGCDRDCGQLRLTPAHTGKTALAASLTRIRRAHPRSREEDPQSFLVKIAVMGSSPLMRGRPRGEGTPCVPEGLIPAHARKTS